jgi:hypothetical protein
VHGGYHWQTGGHGFDQGQAPTFGTCGQHKGVTGPVKIGQLDFGHFAPQQGHIVKAQDLGTKCIVFLVMIGKIVAFDYEFNLRLIGIHLCKCFNGLVYALALFVFAHSQESKWASCGPGLSAMGMEPGAIYSFGHDAYAIGGDAMGRQHTVTPR